MNRNVVIICLDSVRKDFFDRNSPNLRNLSDISMKSCRATSCWSAPSHAGMLSGKLPHQTGVHAYDTSFCSLDPNETIFHEDRPNRIGVSTNEFASDSFNFDKYFDKFRKLTPYKRYPDGISPKKFLENSDISNNSKIPMCENILRYIYESIHSEKSLQSLGNGLLSYVYEINTKHIPSLVDDGGSAALSTAEKLIRSSGEPFISFINLMDAHIPLKPTVHTHRYNFDGPQNWTTSQFDDWSMVFSGDIDRSYLELRKQLYSHKIKYLDRICYNFINNLSKMTSKETTFIVTADHDENLGSKSDDNLLNHISSLSEGLLHVPFEIINPPKFEDGSVNQEQNYSHLQLPNLVDSISGGKLDISMKTFIGAEVVGNPIEMNK